MALPVEVLGRVPAGNLHVSRAVFGEVWVAAEELLGRARPGAELDFVQGVVDTCRWVAGAEAASAVVGRQTVPRSPTHHKLRYPMPEHIEAEYTTARRARDRARRVGEAGDREHAVAVTLEWIWLGGAAPVNDDLRELIEAL